MNPIVSQIFGGLPKGYYQRQFIFGLALAALLFFGAGGVSGHLEFRFLIWIVVSTFLYPYSRFVYESVIGFIFGENQFLVNAIMLLVVKFITMTMCWLWSIFIAPVGLAYLFYRNHRSARNSKSGVAEK